VPDRKPFLNLARERVVVLDGAMGSNLQTRPLDLHRDWMGQENISEVLNFSRPDVIQEIHEIFLEVGCDAVETNTFGANKIVLAEADMPERVFENNKAAAEIARRACDKFETADRPRYVVGSIGPGTKLITLGMTDWETMLDSYAEQVRGLLAGGADVLLIETQQDLLCIKCAIAACNVAFAEAARRLPIMVQGSFDTNGGQSMLTGSDPSAFVAAFEPFREVDVLGVNCAFGPPELTETVRAIAAAWPRLVSALPNAGLPIMVDGKSHFPMGPADFTKGMMRFVQDFGVNIVGGCCGTMPEHLGMLCDALGIGTARVGRGLAPSPGTPGEGRGEGDLGRPKSLDQQNHPHPNPLPEYRERGPEGAPAGVQAKPRHIAEKPQLSSLMSAEDIRQDKSYLIVAERTNTNGSRQFKRLLQAEDWDGLVSMGRDEMREGSHVLDVCVDFVGRDGVRDMHEVVKRYVNSINAPLMLDSTNPAVLEAGLKLAGGRCVLNSMNLEDGEEKMAYICRLATKYGAAVVAGTIDEDKLNAMARTKERKLAIAIRIRDIAAKYGLRDEDLMFDPLVLPISTGIEEDRRNALETIEGTRLISQQLPKCHTCVGLSNVSFGLKPAARVVLNSVFLHELREAGLTGAIVHVSKILPKNRIPAEQWDAALELIYDRRREGFDPLTAYISLFPDEGAVPAEAGTPVADLPIEEKLRRHIIDGEKRNLTADLDEARAKYPPLAIINDHLLDGMKVVGELFGSGQMQLPFVLQSAETMKAAVAYLEPFMDKAAGSTKGKIVLATVKGDVHDIGKNLVDIILTNNGYTVYNLGIKQPVGDILKAAKAKSADAIGMSGLLVKSVAVMKDNLEELNAAGVDVPVLLGGAALTRDYAVNDLANLYKGKLFYCKDAFSGLSTMDAIVGGSIQAFYDVQQAEGARRNVLRETKAYKGPDVADLPAKSDVRTDNPVPLPPFWGRREVRNIPLEQVFAYINPNALFLGQWDFKKKGLTDEAYEKLLDEKCRPVFAELQKRAVAEKLLEPKVVYGYFPVQSDGDDLVVYHTEEFVGCTCGGHGPGKLTPAGTPREWHRFSFPRQNTKRRLCVSDFFRGKATNEYDVLGLQLVTVGDRSAEVAQELFQANRYQDYLYLHGFGVESAEGLAELWHKRMRQEMGFGSEDAPRISQLFQQGYRGSRFSFGYGACPNLEDRAKIVDMLRPETIGVTLSEAFMLVPEQSTDAIVVHHPQAKYFDT
jgi:5-methyltetrahydrofolate--homocysteine methyltransferase